MQSTLLNVLSGQIQSGGHWKVLGAIQLGGQALPKNRLAAITAHVPQYDMLMRALSVEECLRWGPGCGCMFLQQHRGFCVSI